MQTNFNAIKTLNIRFRKRDTFQQYVRSRVERHFRMSGIPRHGGWRMFVKTATILLWVLASYITLVFFAHNFIVAMLSSLSLGLAVAGVGFNIQHDAGHKAYSNKKNINWLMSLSLDLMGGSSYIWNVKHNKLHHTFTNIVGHDDDIELGALARLAPEQPRYWFHRYQHIYLWFLYPVVAIKWHFVDDFRDVIRARIGNHPIDRPKGIDLVAFILGKIIFMTLALGLPCFFHSVLAVVSWYLITMGITGLVMSSVFQLAHVVDNAAYPMPDMTTGDMEESWAIHQMQTTVDFAPKSKVLTWFLGGLNYQAEHHLLSNVSHLHYPRISKLVERACKRYNVPYHVHPTLMAGLISHARQLRALGRPTLA
jgi:linoleoyl-CoA desaturase